MANEIPYYTSLIYFKYLGLLQIVTDLRYMKQKNVDSVLNVSRIYFLLRKRGISFLCIFSAVKNYFLNQVID